MKPFTSMERIIHCFQAHMSTIASSVVTITPLKSAQLQTVSVYYNRSGDSELLESVDICFFHRFTLYDVII